MRYTKEFKQAVLKKYYQSPRTELAALAKEVGIGKSTLHKWVKLSGYGRIEEKSAESKRPQDWTRVDKLQALLDSAHLTSEELGRFCRQRGIHSHQLTTWKTEMIQDQEKSSKLTKKQQDELKALRAENKALKSDLQRKEKALAETSALLVLKKKAHLIWGGSEADG